MRSGQEEEPAFNLTFRSEEKPLTDEEVINQS
jgi:hypothetical protein